TPSKAVQESQTHAPGCHQPKPRTLSGKSTILRPPKETIPSLQVKVDEVAIGSSLSLAQSPIIDNYDGGSKARSRRKGSTMGIVSRSFCTA
ncbi:MAG: hypothetical protein ACKO96_13980, partial [Flammeovirgaceae bacterium]